MSEKDRDNGVNHTDKPRPPSTAEIIDGHLVFNNRDNSLMLDRVSKITRSTLETDCRATLIVRFENDPYAERIQCDSREADVVMRIWNEYLILKKVRDNG